mgnify:CR=1 FL=1
MGTKTRNRLRYSSIKFHFSLVVLCMALGGALMLVKFVVFGYDPFWFWLIPFMPLAVYFSTFSLIMAITLGRVAVLELNKKITVWHDPCGRA